MPQKVLALYLDSPLQSWGYQSRFERRTSLSYPTRSGVIGLLCAAIGIDRRDGERLQRLDKSLGMEIYAFGVSSTLTDYHTVGGGYDRRLLSQSIVRTADGKIGETVQTYREYLQEVRFGVLLRADERLLEELHAALTDPKWGIWLGRKSCVPACPVAQGVMSDEEALEHLGRLAGCRPTRKIWEVDRFDQGSDTILDRPVDFFSRRFEPRRVEDKPL